MFKIVWMHECMCVKCIVESNVNRIHNVSYTHITYSHINMPFTDERVAMSASSS